MEDNMKKIMLLLSTVSFCGMSVAMEQEASYNFDSAQKMEVKEWRNVGSFTGHMVTIEVGKNSSVKIFGYVTPHKDSMEWLSKDGWQECGFNNTVAVISNVSRLFVLDPLFEQSTPVTVRDMTPEEAANLYEKIKNGSMSCEKPYYCRIVMEKLEQALPKGENIKG